MKQYFFTFLFLVLLGTAYAQETSKVKVPNDDAEKAAVLILDSTLHKSNTTNCTLEENCLNRSLTAKCLVYHNDQWFTFTTSGEPEYYVIVKNQNCRDINGVQLLILDGTLCSPATYEIIQCTSLSTQDDIFVTLKGLKNHHTYIINLDGYLNDYCEFEIGVSTRPPDFNIELLRSASEARFTPLNDTARIDWKLTPELQDIGIKEFEIQRRYQSEKKFKSVDRVESKRMVTGMYETDYTYLDTVNRKGTYHYRLLAIDNSGKRFMLQEYTLNANPVKKSFNLINPILEFKPNTVVVIEVYNVLNRKLLGSFKTTYIPGKFTVDLDPYFREDVLRIKLLIKDTKGKNSQEIIVNRNFK